MLILVLVGLVLVFILVLASQVIVLVLVLVTQSLKKSLMYEVCNELSSDNLV